MTASHDEILRRLKVVRTVAIIDAVLLVALLIVAFGLHEDGIVSVLGPIHGIGFLLQLFLVAKGAGEGWWGWWFPIAVIVTLGPPGAFYGDQRVRRELATTH